MAEKKSDTQASPSTSTTSTDDSKSLPNITTAGGSKSSPNITTVGAPKSSPSITTDGLKSSTSTTTDGFKSSTSTTTGGSKSSPNITAAGGSKSSPNITTVGGLKSSPSTITDGLKSSTSTTTDGSKSSTSTTTDGSKSSTSTTTGSSKSSTSTTTTDGSKSSPEGDNATEGTAESQLNKTWLSPKKKKRMTPDQKALNALFGPGVNRLSKAIFEINVQRSLFQIKLSYLHGNRTLAELLMDVVCADGNNTITKDNIIVPLTSRHFNSFTGIQYMFVKHSIKLDQCCILLAQPTGFNAQEVTKSATEIRATNEYFAQNERTGIIKLTTYNLFLCLINDGENELAKLCREKTSRLGGIGKSRMFIVVMCDMKNVSKMELLEPFYTFAYLRKLTQEE